MKTIYRLVAFLLLLAPAVLAQEHYTEGPVWRVSLIRVKPTAMESTTSVESATSMETFAVESATSTMEPTSAAKTTVLREGCC